jgi:hypothetical protein
MFRRRIEITRERWTRFSIRSSVKSPCPVCHRAPHLVTVSEAGMQARLPAEKIAAAIASGVIQVWTAGDTQLICLHCLNDIREVI